MTTLSTVKTATASAAKSRHENQGGRELCYILLHYYRNLHFRCNLQSLLSYL